MSATEVHLAIYDLSRGMARSLSSQFLGANHAIDIIPHTGIIAFGKEYLFGSMGIDFMDPSEFRRSHQIFPIEVQSLGHTQKSREEFEDWCTRVTIHGPYDGPNYNLFHRNCNNFSHDAALQGLGLTRGVPTWILDTPSRFLSSPLGQMITPMLQQMQITGPRTGSHFRGNGHHQVNTSNVSPSSAHSSVQADLTRSVTKSISTPILDSHDGPLLSTDKKSATICIDKLLEDTHRSSDSETVAILTKLKDILITDEVDHSTTDSLQNTILVLLKFVNDGQKSDILHSLIILRLVVVVFKDVPISVKVLANLSNCLHTDSLVSKNPSALSMTWCVISNVIGSNHVTNTLDHDQLVALVDNALASLNTKSNAVQVRQIITAFLYNTAHYLNSSNSVLQGQDDDSFLHDVVITILCGAMESLSTENDSLTKLRRLMVIGKVLRPSKTETDLLKMQFTLVKNLLIDLGFLEIRNSSPGQGSGDSDVEKKSDQLLCELQLLLKSVA